MDIIITTVMIIIMIMTTVTSKTGAPSINQGGLPARVEAGGGEIPPRRPRIYLKVHRTHSHSGQTHG
jgi:hypothetical protein